jgi:serine-type D-Ala-D-Ala carboxypeptidase (penicillin-binding protein 5/6)
MKWRNRILFFCALILPLIAWGQDAESEGVRPSGIAPGPVRKARAVTAKDKQDVDVSPSPVQKSTKSTQGIDSEEARPSRSARKARAAKSTQDVDSEDEGPSISPSPAGKTQAAKSTHPRTRRTHAKSKEERESTPPTEYTPEGIPKTSAASVLVVDANTGQTLYEKNADQIRAPASTQKLLTALIVAERGFLDQPVTVQTVDTMADPVKLNIKPGDTYQRIDLLRALLVKSPNDVARCLARDNAGSVEAFAEVMNRRARELGAVHSHFVNPNGLPVPGQYSTARDLSLIARAAYANSTIRSIVCLPQLVFRYANGRTRELENTNKLLRRLPYCNGMKTGYTDSAGKCLIASGARPGRDVIAVVLGDSSSRVWRDAAALLSWSLWTLSSNGSPSRPSLTGMAEHVH